MTTTIEDLKRYASTGRGLWVGLFLPAYPVLKHPIVSMLPDDAHITLLHLGKDRTPQDVEILCEVIAGLWKFVKQPLEIELTGVGWFWRRRAPTLITLVNSAQIFAMRGTMIGMLGDRDVLPNDAYGFIPHVTLKPDMENANSLANKYFAGPAVRIEIPAITVVCGDGAVSYT